jgi:hypothetical protein
VDRTNSVRATRIDRSPALDAGQKNLLGIQMAAGYWVVVELVDFWVVETAPDGATVVPFE